ncbi:MAG TPA: 4-hydroxy-tetrahydrodipicolinate synthase [Actinomycetota bacterium]|nr:4-hydroxy-tetrahydrodipicolinate synthase [Actinomycetota bacterium]
MAGRFGAVITAMVTPFRDDYSLDLDGAQALARRLLETGSDGLVVAGSTGEAPTLSHREKVDLFRAVVEAAEGRGKVICGTGTYDTAETVELTRAAEEAGADAVLVVTPYYNRPPQRGLVAHFTKVAESTALPVILYNIPGRTACTIEQDTLLRLAEVDNIVAVKDSTGDFQALSRLFRELPPDFEVYSGDDWATLPMCSLGAKGVVSVASHLVGERIRDMVEMVHAGDLAGARKVHDELTPLFRALFVTSNPIPVKAALEIAGHPVGPPRLPLVPASPEERGVLERALRDVGVI